VVTQFTNSLEPDFRSREVFTFHRPEEPLSKWRSRRRSELRGWFANPSVANRSERTLNGTWALSRMRD
jgi:hypothetical protein